MRHCKNDELYDYHSTFISEQLVQFLFHSPLPFLYAIEAVVHERELTRMPVQAGHFRSRDCLDEGLYGGVDGRILMAKLHDVIVRKRR